MNFKFVNKHHAFVHYSPAMSSITNSKLLNARELIAVTNLQNEIEATVLVRGVKATHPTNTDEERATIESYQDDLRRVLSLERVALKGSRSVASLENGIIKIIKRSGKWEGFESTGTFLEPHEALFLMETNRLEVYMGKMIVSLERAYHLFLDHALDARESAKLTKMEYLVYSHFIRFGCNLKRFKNEMPPCDGFRDDSSSDSDTNVDKNTSDSLYVWNYLYDLLGHRRSILATENIDRNHYTRVKQSMDNIINTYKDQNQSNSCQNNQIVSDTNVSDSPEHTEPPQSKRRKLSNCNASNAESAAKLTESNHGNDFDDLYFGSGSLNDYMIGNTFQRFKQIFDKIDIIELKTMDYDEDDDHRNGNENVNSGCGSSHNHWSTTEKFSFDLWTSWDCRRTQQSTKPPNFRLIVKQPSKSLPRNDDIFRLYRSLVCKSAIIVVCINEEMSFQAYVYRFTT